MAIAPKITPVRRKQASMDLADALHKIEANPGPRQSKWPAGVIFLTYLNQKQGERGGIQEPAMKATYIRAVRKARVTASSRLWTPSLPRR